MALAASRSRREWDLYLFTTGRACRQNIRSYSQSSTRHKPAVQFYQNKLLESYALKPAHRLTLRQLVFYGRSMNEERLIKSANYVRTELPIRLAHRVRDIQALPYVVVTHEAVAQVYNLYCSAFEKFRRFPEIRTMKDNQRFCDFCKGMLNEHISAIPRLALGMSLASQHLEPDQLDSFMRRMLVSRISRRVLVEHHVSLTESTARNEEEDQDDDDARNVGIIFTKLDPHRSLKKCVELLKRHTTKIMRDLPQQTSSHELPEVIIDGQKNVRFAYIREHLEYILFELLKNAMESTLTKHGMRGSTGPPPCIRATIVAGPDEISIRLSDQGGGIVNPHVTSTEDLFSFSHARNAARIEDARIDALRDVSMRARGLLATVKEQTEEDKLEDEAPGQAAHPRLGIGLPMSNIYATYFGGSLELMSLDGWGTDVYLKLPKLGTNLEGLEV